MGSSLGLRNGDAQQPKTQTHPPLKRWGWDAPAGGDCSLLSPTCGAQRGLGGSSSPAAGTTHGAFDVPSSIQQMDLGARGGAGLGACPIPSHRIPTHPIAPCQPEEAQCAVSRTPPWPGSGRWPCWG